MTLALLLTVMANIFGVVSVPLLATWLVSVKGVKINAVSLLIKLFCSVLIPLIVSYILYSLSPIPMDPFFYLFEGGCSTKLKIGMGWY